MKRWSDVFGSIGTVAASLLSCAACPLCLPLYAGLLSIIGIELVEIHHFFFPIMMAFGCITLGSMAYQIYKHHGQWTPFHLAVGATLSMVTSAFFGYEYLLYLSLAFFMGSVFWYKKSLRHKGHGCC
ncbi:MAG: MerC domain-containing protein [Alphaproteobacteria bacterium]|nr:MerC domain-containing protein [Alphaproteobacteria bacterium]MBP9777434.1 MerC domain-containing protein [Alphaproteobacteria bacterium]MDP3442229.1 MerC family mercury resistance protein [Ignavibacteria bacterium]